MSDLRLNFLHLADGATVDKLGKLSVFGIFTKVFLDEVPGRLLKFAIVGNVTLTPGIGKKVNLQIKIFDEKGEELKIPAPTSRGVPVSEDKVKKGGDMGFIIELGNQKFHKFGKHKVAVYINDKALGSVEFQVEKRS